jgi:hypothetical protein
MNEQQAKIDRIFTNWNAASAYLGAIGVSRNGALVSEVSRRIGQLNAFTQPTSADSETLGRLIDALRDIGRAFERATPDVVTEGRRLADHLDEIWTDLSYFPTAA